MQYVNFSIDYITYTLKMPFVNLKGHLRKGVGKFVVHCRATIDINHVEEMHSKRNV